MAFPKVVILDVGHGNSVVVHDTKGNLVFDAGGQNTLTEYLLQAAMKEIYALFISHCDKDHLGGAINLLAARQLRVRHVYLNPDPLKTGSVFGLFRRTLADARTRRGTRVHVGLSTDQPANFSRGEARIEILAPTPEIAVSGVGGTDLSGRTLSGNRMSAVIRLVVSGKPILLLPGDLDHVGLENLEATGTQMSSRVLVFPHHGGRPGGGNAGEFAKKLTRLVSPELVVFSNGRGKHNNPNPVIVDGVRQAAPSAVVACTQLSEVCAKDIPNPLPHPVSSYYSAGHGRGYSCAGSIELRCNPSAELFPLVRDHGAFVTKNAPTALCRLPLPDVRGQARTATPRKRT